MAQSQDIFSNAAVQNVTGAWVSTNGTPGTIFGQASNWAAHDVQIVVKRVGQADNLAIPLANGSFSENFMKSVDRIPSGWLVSAVLSNGSGNTTALSITYVTG